MRESWEAVNLPGEEEYPIHSPGSDPKPSALAQATSAGEKDQEAANLPKIKYPIL